MTSEQLEAARAERMRQNGLGTLTLEDARTWIEETGLCLFLPKRQISSSIAPSFVEAVAGHTTTTPDPKHISLAEELLVRLEADNVAVRLNLLGQPGEQPDFIVAAWVLPYVYALRGDRDWRRSPQLTGSRQVSQLAIMTYKLLESGESTIPQLKQALGREVSEAAVLRAITELWQQLRIIPVIATPGKPAKWQLLRTRYQRAIAEGASTSQVTAISVLSSIFLQAVIAATMEDVELFLAPLTARSKIREVIRGLVATRQVHTLSMGHAPHYYVAGTLPEFEATPALYASATIPASAYFTRTIDHDDEPSAPPSFRPLGRAASNGSSNGALVSSAASIENRGIEEPEGVHASRTPIHKTPSKPAAPRSHFSRQTSRSRDRKPVQSSGNARPVRRASDARPGLKRSGGTGSAGGSRWGQSPAKARSNGTPVRSSNGNGTTRSATASWTKGKSHTNSAKTGSKQGVSIHKSGRSRPEARSSRSSRKPLATAGVRSGGGKRFGFTARAKQGTKKRG